MRIGTPSIATRLKATEHRTAAIDKQRRVTRRALLGGMAAVATQAAVNTNAHGLSAFVCQDQPTEGEWRSDWQQHFDKPLVGPDCWATPLKDWALNQGRVECRARSVRDKLHLLTHQTSAHTQRLVQTVTLGSLRHQRLSSSAGSAGFELGVKGHLDDYRSNLYGTGIKAGISGRGWIFIDDQVRPLRLGARVQLTLRLEGSRQADRFALVLTAHDERGEALARVGHEVAAERIRGNLALCANYPDLTPAGERASHALAGQDPNASADSFWFQDWSVQGYGLDHDAKRRFGPILFSQYCLSRGRLTLSVQMVPLSTLDARDLELQFRAGKSWQTFAKAEIDPDSSLGVFRLEDWDDQHDRAYRVRYWQRYKDGSEQPFDRHGTVRRNPTDKPKLSVANISCNFHTAFPNPDYVGKVERLDPDLLVFTGDQFYEHSCGYEPDYGATFNMARLDYFERWFLHGWTWATLTRNRPSICLPDDHDVFQGNMWGLGGAAARDDDPRGLKGGLIMSPRWLKMMFHSQCGHHPPNDDDAAPIARGLPALHTALTYGGVSFALLSDRLFKSAPGLTLNLPGERPDHVRSTDFDASLLDPAGAELLGARQEAFLKRWNHDWHGAEMKAVVSASLFSGLANIHGPKRDALVMDLDANGWPQTPRNTALREMRKSFAVHLSGDQHLPAVVQYGIDEHGDAPFAFSGPGVNVNYPRWWEPGSPGVNRTPGAPEYTGEFMDPFGHPLTVLAVAGGVVDAAFQQRARAQSLAFFADPEEGHQSDVLVNMDGKSSGIGMVTFDKPRRRIRIDCWPYLADVSQAGTQFPGWPIEIEMRRNDARPIWGHLPAIEVLNSGNAVFKLFAQESGELVYALRLQAPSFRPFVFAAGEYRAKLSEPESGLSAAIERVVATPSRRGPDHQDADSAVSPVDNNATIQVRLTAS